MIESVPICVETAERSPLPLAVYERFLPSLLIVSKLSYGMLIYGFGRSRLTTYENVAILRNRADVPVFSLGQ